jgi:hypothetical protein
MTFDEIRNELGAIRSEHILSDAEASILGVLDELTQSIESVHRRIQEQSLADMDRRKQANWRKLADGNMNVPRRSQLNLNTPAELAIRDAMIAVEEAGAHPLLTDAVNLLQQARDKVADFVDSERSSPISGRP